MNEVVHDEANKERKEGRESVTMPSTACSQEVCRDENFFLGNRDQMTKLDAETTMARFQGSDQCGTIVSRAT